MSQVIVPFVTVGVNQVVKVRAQLPYERARLKVYLVAGGPVFGWFGRDFDSYAAAAAESDGTKGQPSYDFAAAAAAASPAFDIDGTDNVVSIAAAVATQGFLIFEERRNPGADRPHPHQQGRTINR